MMVKRKPVARDARLRKSDPGEPALQLTRRGTIEIKAGTIFAGRRFPGGAAIELPELAPGTDYFVRVPKKGAPKAMVAAEKIDADVIGGFHFAPGGNAKANAGGDEKPSINPFSIWDLNFRPAAKDPRGMTLITPALIDELDYLLPAFWADIYLLASDHRAGTSRYGATIADGVALPEKTAPHRRYDKLDYETAVAVLAEHGKQLLTPMEFFAAAYGVAEASAAGSDPVTTKLDAARTSRSGLMQATGNMWIWGTDGHPVMPRASLFGGFWWDDVSAGSRRANVAYSWPVDSFENIGARGRCDHLLLVEPPRKRRPTKGIAGER